MFNLLSTAPIQWIQTFRTPFLDRFFTVCNFFDSATFAVLLVLSIGLIINRKLGVKLAIILCIAALLNKALKLTFDMPRPVHLDPSLGILTASSPGFPSGAAQNSLLLCGVLIKEWSNPMKWILGTAYVVIICISRMYLGLHFPIDIVGGLLFGVILLIIYLQLTPKITGIIVMSSFALLGHQAHGAIYQDHHISLDIPQEQLAYQSFTIQADDKQYKDWTTEDHSSSYRVMQAAAEYFQNGPFLVLGENPTSSRSPFQWQFVPFDKTTNVVSRYWQQLQVAFRVFFGGTHLTNEQRSLQKSLFVNAFNQTETVKAEDSDGEKSTDPFCNDAIVEKQLVKEGKHVRILYDYRPVGESHFLIVPKAHQRDFRQLTEEEYIEASELSQFVMRKLKESQPVANTYLMHKTQIDAGQSVPHWHLHIITTGNAQDDFWSKASFLWRMTFGSSPLPNDELSRRVNHYRGIFN